MDKSRLLNPEQKLNILLILVTCDVSKLLKSREANPRQDLNILLIFVTCDVSKLLKSREGNPEQLANILFMLFTFEVLKLLKSREMDPNGLILKNIPLMSIALLVSKLDKSRKVRLPLLLKKLLMSVTCDVLIMLYGKVSNVE